MASIPNASQALLLPLFVTPVPDHYVTSHTPFAPHVLHPDQCLFMKDPGILYYDPPPPPPSPLPAQPPPHSSKFFTSQNRYHNRDGNNRDNDT